MYFLSLSLFAFLRLFFGIVVSFVCCFFYLFLETNNTHLVFSLNWNNYIFNIFIYGSVVIHLDDKCANFQLFGLFFSSGNPKQHCYEKKEIRKINYFFSVTKSFVMFCFWSWSSSFTYHLYQGGEAEMLLVAYQPPNPSTCHQKKNSGSSLRHSLFL